jgi:hypothetical protein
LRQRRVECFRRIDDDMLAPDGAVAVYKIVGHDEAMGELEALLPGDSVAVQGRLEIESKNGRLAGLFVVALQVMALRKRSVNRLPHGSPMAARL